MNIIETLKRLEHLMQGVHEYDSTWINYPDKPEQAPADLLRAVIKQLEAEHRTPKDRRHPFVATPDNGPCSSCNHKRNHPIHKAPAGGW